MHRNRNAFKALALATLALAAAPAARLLVGEERAASRTRYNLLGEGVGLVGYDPVSYFPERGGKPRKGLIDISHQHEGVTYRFATKENLALFSKNPQKYLPAYGGWCAWAAAELGKRVDVDPEAFEIRNGKLYVFYRDPAVDTRTMWRKDPNGMIAKADANWPGLAR